MGHVGWVAEQRRVACAYLQQFLHWEEPLGDNASSTLGFCERMMMPGVRVATCWRSTVTTTEVACLVPRDTRLGLRYWAERIGVALSLRIAWLRYGRVPLHLRGRSGAGGSQLPIVGLWGRG